MIEFQLRSVVRRWCECIYPRNLHACLFFRSKRGKELGLDATLPRFRYRSLSVSGLDAALVPKLASDLWKFRVSS
jgi:hypothetical protein